MTRYLGLIGLTLNLIGTLLVLDRLITLKSLIGRLENRLSDLAFKYVKRMCYNLLDQYLKRFPYAPDRELTLLMMARVRSGDFPEIEEWQRIRQERKRMLKKDGHNKQNYQNDNRKRKHPSLAFQIKNSFMIRVLVTNNPYLMPILCLGLLKSSVKFLQQYQIHIGAIFFIIGNVFQIIEKILEI